MTIPNFSISAQKIRRGRFYTIILITNNPNNYFV